MKRLRVLLLKDARCLLRARGFLPASTMFALLLVVVSSFSFRRLGLSQSELFALTPGIIWMIFLFTSVSILSQSFIAEKENRAMQGLVLSGAKPESIFISKFLVNSSFIFLLQALVILLHSIFFAVDLFSHYQELLLISFLAALSFSALGTIISSMAVCARGRELLLPLLLFPLCLPLLAALVFLTNNLLETGLLIYSSFWFVFLFVFAVLSFLLSLLLFEYVVRE